MSAMSTFRLHGPCPSTTFGVLVGELDSGGTSFDGTSGGVRCSSKCRLAPVAPGRARSIPRRQGGAGENAGELARELGLTDLGEFGEFPR